MKRLRAWLYHLSRWLRLAGLLPSTGKADTDTMGQWKRLQALPDDPGPRYVLPPPGPYADLIRRVRLYAQNGAKALGPLLDRPLPILNQEAGSPIALDGLRRILVECAPLIESDGSPLLESVRGAFDPHDWDAGVICAVHAAYNAPWTIVDGEPMEVVYSRAPDPSTEVMQ